jgi:methionyl-tRNA formyltransferase
MHYIKTFRFFSPSNINDLNITEFFKEITPDLIVVCAYGQIFPRKLLDLAKLGCFNIHFSFLPKWRGASPVQSAILAGDHETGISIQKMVMKLDAGPIISESKPTSILKTDTSRTLGSRLSLQSKYLLLDSIDKMILNKNLIDQDEDKVSFCGLIKKEMGRINWLVDSPGTIDRKLRAYDPWPGIYSYINGTRINLLELEKSNYQTSFGIIQSDFTIGCKNGSVKVTKVKPEGKNIMTGEEFLRGRSHLIHTLLD